MNIDTRHLSMMEEFQARHRTGLITLLFTDLAGSTKLKTQLGDAVAGAILGKHHSAVRELLKQFPSAKEVSTAGDSFFLVFDSPSNAVLFSTRLHRRMRELSKQVGHPVRDRIGIHVGEVFFEEGQTEGRVQNFTGIHVDTCARVMSVCEPDRTLMTRFAFDNAQQTLTGQQAAGRLFWMSHGLYEFKGVAQPLEVCEVWEQGFPKPKELHDTEKAHRFMAKPATLLESDSEVEKAEGWRGAVAKRRREILLSTVAAWAAIAIVCLAPPLMTKFDGISYDFAYYMKPSSPVPDEAVILYLDEHSHEELKQKDYMPWDHSIHARLVDRLTRAKAKAIVFDFLFLEEQPGTTAFAKACSQSGRVFVAALEKGTDSKASIVMPIENIRSNTNITVGLVPLFPANAPARRYTGNYGDHDLGLKTLGQLVAERMAEPKVPAQKGTWLNYYGPPGSIPSFSYAAALTNEAPDSAFKDKAVFIGGSSSLHYARGRSKDEDDHVYDQFPTPFGKAAAGVELNATAALNFYRGESLSKISALAEAGIFLALAVVIAILVSFAPTLWVVIGSAVLAICLAFGSSWLVWQSHEWFSWAVVSLIEIPVIVVASIAARTDRLTRQKKQLEQTLAAQHSEFMTKASLLQSQNTAAYANRNKAGELPIPDHELFSIIGKGAYGEVWLGKDITNSFRAIKIVRAKNFSSDRPFDREFEGIKRFAPLSRSHPGLVDVLHVGKNEEEGWFFYIMEAADDIVSGRHIDPARYRPRTLASIIEENHALAPKEFLSIAVQLCDALEFLHGNGLLHRDIKPANVLYVNGRPQLADPGLVAGAGEDASGATMIGTLGYMAPDRHATARSDIFSLGKMFYQAGFGRPVAAFPELPTFLIDTENQVFISGLNDIVLKACAPNPQERYASAGDLRRALKDLAHASGIVKNVATETSI